MRALSAGELLGAWEHGRRQAPARRGLTLLALACRDLPEQELAELSIGLRDRRLLELREQTFGRGLPGLASCPACREALEFQADTALLRREPAPPRDGELRLAAGEWHVSFRLPNSLDLAALDPAADSGENERTLLGRCVLSAERAGVPAAAADLPEELVGEIARRMAEADPQADLQFGLVCPACGHGWSAPFDILSYFWTELQAQAQRLLREVHVLASAYGWSEAEVLALSPTRRRAYLEMVEP